MGKFGEFKNPDNPLCIDLILTKSPRSFQDRSVFEIITVLKQYFPKSKPKIGTIEISEMMNLEKNLATRY